ncbi:hypothetical protein GALMADRAFT_139719 [Galerina marginata CBS 339.88]|uniref:G-protein coupled receptors family 1 profile domain-containing protein n=1 Tax=Galerina marginata (strain CBS 339.88) TaxID=685588 RepID=A0A067TCZ4_GALM3|nr:hypothetical protein GALMADRAFT_139719 [Galerina marginata CBS 339.88]
MPIPVDVAELAGIVVEGGLYGVFLILFGVTIRTLLWKRKLAKLNRIMVVAACLMAVLATCQIVVDTVNIFRAFIPLDRESRIIFLSNPTEPIFAAKHAIYFTMMLVGDAIVTYRAFIVWGRNYLVIAVPVLCSIGSAGKLCAYQTIWAVRHISNVSIKAETGWGIAVFSLSLAANTISTSSIAFKIWQNEQKFSAAFKGYSHSSTRYRRSIMPVARIVAESGVINAAYLLVYTVILVNGTHALEIMANISTPLIGILFAMVIIRAAITAERNMTTNVNSRPHAMELPSTASNPRTQTAIEVNVDWIDDSESSYKKPSMPNA